MKQTEARLQRMIVRLASMRQDDQAYVLDRVGKEARERLVPLLAGTGSSDAISPGLQALVQAVARGQQPPTMKAKAIVALRAVHQVAAEPAERSARVPDGLTARVSALIRQGVR